VRKLYRTVKPIVKMFALLMLVCSVLGFTDAGTVAGNNLGVPVKAIAQGTVLYTGYGLGKAWDWTTDTRGLDGIYGLAGILAAVYVMRRWPRLNTPKAGPCGLADPTVLGGPAVCEQYLSSYGDKLVMGCVDRMSSIHLASQGKTLNERDIKNVARALYQRSDKLAVTKA